ncbi:MAG: enoyl-CoA hydratase/isomerase family protein [Bradyrhizobium sp.]|nr:enoyl-CoA hydratase/isomerase family protein [Bradyrhizobium sp.]
MAVDFELTDGIALVTINRPEALNALDAATYTRLSEIWSEIRDNADIRAAVITGAGERAFCAGADIKTYITRTDSIEALWQTQRGQLLNHGIELWKPVIAAVNGICVGGGMTLLLATDIRLAVAGARFGLPEVKQGVIAANGGTQRILEQLPYALAMELLLTGNMWDAERAERWGLINRIVAPDALIDEAMKVAAVIIANAPLAVQATKELAIRSRDMERAVGLRLEQSMFEILRKTEDATEASAAFRDRRPPRFNGK